MTEEPRDSEEMKGLALWPPYGTLIALGAKWNETRSWQTPYRGWLAIYQTETFPEEAREFCTDTPAVAYLYAGGYRTLGEIPRKRVVALARLECCYPTAGLFEEIELPDRWFGDFAPCRFAWNLRDIWQLTEPVALSAWKMDYRGVFALPDEAKAALLAAPRRPAPRNLIPEENLLAYKPADPPVRLLRGIVTPEGEHSGLTELERKNPDDCIPRVYRLPEPKDSARSCRRT